VSAYNILVRLPQQTLNTQQHTPRVQHRAPRPFLSRPAGLQNIETNPSAHVDVGVVNGGFEEHLRRGVGVVGRVGEREFEGQGGVGRVDGARDGGVPSGDVGCAGEGGEAGGGGGHEGHEFGLEAEGCISSASTDGVCVWWVGGSLFISRDGADVPLDDVPVVGRASLIATAFGRRDEGRSRDHRI